MEPRRIPVLVLLVATAIVAALVASMAGTLVATPAAEAQIQQFNCEQGELVGNQCRIVGPAPQCVSPAQGTPPDCFELRPAADCLSPYTADFPGCYYSASRTDPWWPITGPGDCPPSAGEPIRVFGGGASSPYFSGCEYTLDPCIGGGTFVNGRCRVPVRPSCSAPFELEDGQCVRYVPAEVIIIPGKVTVTYGAACGPDGRVGLTNIQISTENGAVVSAITINGSPNTSTRVDPGGPIDVAVLTNEPSDEIVISGPTTAPTCAGPTPTPPPTRTPTTPTPTPPPTATPSTDDDPVEPAPRLIASVDPGSCAARGQRSVVLTAALSPSSPTDLVQWRVDGAPVGGAETPGTLNIGVDADGAIVTFVARVLDPGGVTPFAERVEIEPCESPGEPSVEVGPCDAAGLRELILVSTGGDEVQWLVDGEPVAPPGPPGPLMGSVVADGGEHVVELVILAPGDLAGLRETIVVEPCERAIAIDVVVGACATGGREVAITVIVEPDIAGDLVQLSIDGSPVGPPAPAGATSIVVAADGGEHRARAELVEPAAGATAETGIVVDTCAPQSLSATTLRQHGRSEVVLPAECLGAEVELPGVEALIAVETGDQGSAVFVTDSTTLDLGEHLATVDCAGTPIEITIFVYRQTGGSRGEGQGLTVASGLGLAGLALVSGVRRRSS